MEDIKNGLIREVTERQLKLLENGYKKLYGNVFPCLDDYSKRDQEETLYEAKDSLISDLREIFSDEKNPALIEMEKIIEEIKL